VPAIPAPRRILLVWRCSILGQGSVARYLSTCVRRCSNNRRAGGVALGAALIVYAVIGLAKLQLSIPRRYEAWLSPAIGAATGFVTGATGVFVIPAALYLQALELDKDDLVQVLGLSFTTSTVALAAGLASHGAFQITDGGISALCTAPALVGMRSGQMIRRKANPATFRVLFLITLLLLGADLIMRSGF
jgi:uncharacterized membrane protein YfcA